MSLKVKLLRKLTRKPYGLARFRVGRTKYSKIVRFDKDQVEWYGGTYIFNKDSITIEKGAGNKKAYNVGEWANHEEGFPVIEFDVNSAVPIYYQSDPQGNLPTAKSIQATIKKWIIATEMELMRKTRSKLMLALMITLIMVLANLGITIYMLVKLTGN